MGRTIIITEIGENHLGDIGRAKKMIKEAAGAGADFVKFQSYLASEVSPNDPEIEWFRKVQLSDEAHRELKKHADNCGIEFLSAPFSLGRAKFLCESLGLRKIKIASSELLNYRLLDYVNKHADTVFLSTGMATMKEVKNSLKHLNKVKNCYILHCVTEYPAKPEHLNLNAIKTLKTAFPDFKVGYSDHTIGVQACLAAVALGAEVIEKHFTLDKSLPGTDHVLSVTPGELKELVKSVRELETMLGSHLKKPTADEERIKNVVRSRFPK
jgi:sialic acid synthase SpsE